MVNRPYILLGDKVKNVVLCLTEGSLALRYSHFFKILTTIWNLATNQSDDTGCFVDIQITSQRTEICIQLSVTRVAIPDCRYRLSHLCDFHIYCKGCRKLPRSEWDHQLTYLHTNEPGIYWICRRLC
jgi:hypothetical protein